MNKSTKDITDGMDKYLNLERMRPGILRWIENGIMPGSFLTTIIENDLKGAISSADIENSCMISSYVHFFYNHAPGGCWGSKERVIEWKNKKSTKQYFHIKMMRKGKDMKYRIVMISLLLGAQPSLAESCHHFSKWYYPYPQKCYASKYVAQVIRQRFKLRPIIRSASVQTSSHPI